MTISTPAMNLRIAEAASSSQQQRSGLAPQSVTVFLGDDTLVITLKGALSPAERILAKSAAGAAQVQEFHRQLFAASSGALLQEIKRITGSDVLEAASEVGQADGSAVHAFTAGTMIQVFELSKPVPDPPPSGKLTH